EHRPQDQDHQAVSLARVGAQCFVDVRSVHLSAPGNALPNVLLTEGKIRAEIYFRRNWRPRKGDAEQTYEQGCVAKKQLFLM
ncbi:hypothetical protein, partial [Achromobacter sp. GbtcB20]|uniref:hypothetical protein n=1 Tax=Achromobacter sp. GbtcB20 TaxID=2824765 RepID=UPI001C2FC49C